MNQTHSFTSPHSTLSPASHQIKSEIVESLKMDGHDSEDPKQSTADMTVFVQNLLQQMQSRFQTMSENIVSKIDEMGGRINELEQSINELRTEMGVEGSPSPLAPSKQMPSEDKEEENTTD